MKRIAASMGLVALGTSMVHAAESGVLNSFQESKAWSVSASLRGFYDDNVNTVKSGSNKVDTVGWELNPSISYGTAGEMTSLNFRYAFSALFRDVMPAGTDDHMDYTHTVAADLSHAFSDRTSLFASDSFVVGQEPDVLRTGNGVIDQPGHISGNNMRNYANVKVNHQATEKMGLEFGYGNTIFDYDDEGEFVSGSGTVTNNSRSGLLDRMQHAIHVDTRWGLSQQTTGIIGYQFSMVDYTADERIAGTTGAYVRSDDRNSKSHYIYGGFEHMFNTQLSGSIRAGLIKFKSDLNVSTNSGSDTSPFIQAALDYRFLPESTLSAGFKIDRNTADFIGNAGDPIKDVETMVFYGTLAHRLAAQWYGTATVNYQQSTYNGGGAGYDGKNLDYLILGLVLEYRINRNFSASVSYNYDHVTSGVLGGTDYDRNRYYLGLTATY